LTDLCLQDAIEQLISPLSPISRAVGDDKPEAVHPTDTAGQTKRSWWSWRRSQDAVPNQANNNIDKSAVKNVNLDKDEKGKLLKKIQHVKEKSSVLRKVKKLIMRSVCCNYF